MSGDVQPRKRKDKRRKKDAPVVQPEYMAQKVRTPVIEDSPEELSNFSTEETIHIHKDHGTGGNICAKIVFFCLLGALAVMVGLIVIEYRGSSEVDTLPENSKWAQTFDGWLDDSPAHHDDPHDGGNDEHDDSHKVSEEVSKEETSGEASKEDHDASEDSPEVSEEDEVSKEDQEASEEDQEASDEDQEASEEDQEASEEDQEASEEDQEASEEDQAVSEEDQESSKEDQVDSEENQDVSEEQADESSEELQDIPGVTESVESQESEEDAVKSEEEDDEGGEEVGDESEQGEEDKDNEKGEAEGDGDGGDEAEVEESGAPAASAAAAELTPEESEDEESDDTPAVPTPVVPPRQRGGPREDEDNNSPSINEAEEIPQDTVEGDENIGDPSPSAAPLQFSEELDVAESRLDRDPSSALQLFTTVLVSEPRNFRALYGKATALDKMADLSRSNARLEEAIQAYRRLLLFGSLLDDDMFQVTARRCINRMRFKGDHLKAVEIHNMMIERYPSEPKYRNELAVTYLMINRISEARHHLVDTLKRWPEDGFALVHYGFILKTADNNLELAVDYLTKGIAKRAAGTIDGRFFFQLSDALSRLGRNEEATKINHLGVREGVFLSEYQRSLYNVDRLKANPWWTVEESTYKPYFEKLQDNWQVIHKEGMAALADKKNNLFEDESESLRDVGNWKQLELYARGRQLTKNCARTPRTCELIAEFPAARDCRRGQAKFSVMEPGTHVFPHCGPTNCRLRAHLGLSIPPGTAIRVATETRTWQEGKVMIFDDSFEHEVWHNGTKTRLVLIVDVWHPELTKEERQSLPAI